MKHFKRQQQTGKGSKDLKYRIRGSAMGRGHFCSPPPHQQAQFTHTAFPLCKKPPNDMPRGPAFPQRAQCGPLPLSEAFLELCPLPLLDQVCDADGF